MSLPPFLERRCSASQTDLPYDALFDHKVPFGLVHALWWPVKHATATPETVLFFIPGNPGLLDLYIPFLSALYDKDQSSTLAIIAHGHIGHTPRIQRPQTNAFGLTFQIQSALEAFDVMRSAFGSQTKIVLLGHSVGAWITLQVLKARPGNSSLFLLFPTISHIASTPNGRRLSWLFRPPLPRLISFISRFSKLLPIRMLSILFPAWPLSQILVLRSFLNSPSSILASLTMANDEMDIISNLDTTLLVGSRCQIWIYYAERDDWVGTQREEVMKVLDVDSNAARVVQGHRDVPHAFCINHGEQLAAQCHLWLTSVDFQLDKR